MMAEIRYQDDWLTIWNGDCRAAMAQMPEQSVQTIITSPPFFGLRDYGNAQWGGGDPECDHLTESQHQKQGATSLRAGRTNVDEQRSDNLGRATCGKCGAVKVEPTIWGGDPAHEHTWGPVVGEVRSSAQGGLAFTGNGAPDTRLPGLAASQPEVASQGNFCECGAWRGALGLEPTPELYVEHLVEVFRAARRVLRDDGILWLNLGDSYARSQDTNVPQTKNPKVPFPGERSMDWSAVAGSSDGKVGRANRPGSRSKASGLKPKDLIGIPWLVAFALREDGWFLRQDIIWAKPNAMPESVEDRPTRSHEFIFMLAKGQWKSTVIQLSDSDGQNGAFFQGLSREAGSPGHLDFGVRLASTILQFAETQNEQSLPSLDAEVGQESTDGNDGDLVARLPVVHRATELASLLVHSKISAEQFLGQLNGLGITLADDHHFRIGGAATFPLPPGVYSDGDAAVAIDYPGEVCKFDFTHDKIVVSRPSTCSYYYDHIAVKEPASESTLKTVTARMKSVVEDREYQHDSETRMGKRSPNRVWSDEAAMQRLLDGRNLRDVWSIPTAPYAGAHYAVFPPKLVEPMVKASTSEAGACPECGALFRRVTESVGVTTIKGGRPHDPEYGRKMHEDSDLTGEGIVGSGFGIIERDTVGWKPTCAHEYVDPMPCVVLDPFGGSGTVGVVAQQFGRRAVLVDLNPDYIEQQMRRNANVPLGL